MKNGIFTEKCVDIALAVELMHYATLENSFDVGIVVMGDADFIPVLQRVRQRGKQVGTRITFMIS